MRTNMNLGHNDSIPVTWHAKLLSSDLNETNNKKSNPSVITPVTIDTLKVVAVTHQ